MQRISEKLIVYVSSMSETAALIKSMLTLQFIVCVSVVSGDFERLMYFEMTKISHCEVMSNCGVAVILHH